jgi:predicted ferric reductase
MVIIYFVGLFIHVFHRLKVQWLWVSVTFWAIDRSLRTLRLVWLNIPWRHFRRGCSKAEITYLSDDVIRVKVAVAQPWNYLPGQSVYLYFPTLRYGFWQSHPFSILNRTEEYLDTKSGDEGRREVNELENRQDQQTAFTTEDGDKSFESPLLPAKTHHNNRKEKYFHFLVKAQTGLTRRLRDMALSNNSCHLTTFVEGPYGVSHKFDNFTTVLFISGGVAVTFTMSHLVYLAEKKSRNPGLKVKQVHHVWVVRKQEDIAWISEELDQISQLTLPNNFLRMSFYVSQGIMDINQQIPVPKLGNAKCEILPRRADVPRVISDEAQERLGKMAVVGLVLPLL